MIVSIIYIELDKLSVYLSVIAPTIAVRPRFINTLRVWFPAPKLFVVIQFHSLRAASCASVPYLDHVPWAGYCRDHGFALQINPSIGRT